MVGGCERSGVGTFRICYESNAKRKFDSARNRFVEKRFRFRKSSCRCAWQLRIRPHGCLHAHVMNQGNKGVPGKTCVPGQVNVYLADSERATNDEASIRENEPSAGLGTLTNPRTQVTNQHSFRIHTRGAKGP